MYVRLYLSCLILLLVDIEDFGGIGDKGIRG